ncbi:helicase-related protein [Rhodococcus sp. 27YEA6]|uniref:helicase-related protein n=1 Tax=Rhodococcus sp. 27YEA6 TaxID=3156273 RepID=UPI00383624B0
MYEQGQRVRLERAGLPAFATVRYPIPAADGGITLILLDDDGVTHEVTIRAGDTSTARPLVSDGRAGSASVLAGMWTRWMDAAASNAETSAMAATPLRPYAHQRTAVYGAMLPQPQLRFLLADEPGTGKTIMAGLYIREMQRMGLIRRTIIVCPANLCTKWVADFDRLLGGGLKHLTAETIQQGALPTSDMWVVSLELAAMNGAVAEAIRPDLAGWDLVVFDEAHRLTPTATSFHQVGRLLAKNTPRALLMTATPHRGKEWLFRHLLHLVDPEIYPDPGDDPKVELQALRPGPTHFLRRMKEDLFDYDENRPLFKGRTAANHSVPLSSMEFGFYTESLDMVDRYFPPAAQTLARMVYGKRAASSLHALAETLRRRQGRMGEWSEAEAALYAERSDFGDEGAVDEAKVVNSASRATREEQTALKDLLGRLDAAVAGAGWTPSKWSRLTEDCLAINGVRPGTTEQAVVFTEYADTAEWIRARLVSEGYTARTYSGRQSRAERDETRSEFMRGQFQIIVTTDAGNEGIDLQAAHVLVNYDIPWSLVRLEQRMGRIHRVGQTRDVFLYNLVATDTREGDTMMRLLENFVVAANELHGQMFDSLSAVAEITGVDYEKWLTDLYGDNEDKKHIAIEAAKAIQTQDMVRQAREVRDTERRLASQVDAVAAMTLLQRDLFSRINPAIIEAYLDRLQATGWITAQGSAAGTGFRQITIADGVLPTSLGGGASVHVATSGTALSRAAEDIDVSGIITLGPGEPGFSDLIRKASESFAESMFQSGAVQDPSSLTPYELYAYESSMSESGGSRTSIWATLIKVDDSGSARPVRWEALANLTPTARAGTLEHPARAELAQTAALEVAVQTRLEHQKVRADWFTRASKDLKDLPVALTEEITDRAERMTMRKVLRAQTARRLEGLEKLVDVTLSDPELVGRIRVWPAADDAMKEEIDSEMVSMRLVAKHLESDGWKVADVHMEFCGYDLEARRGGQRRNIEVKGVAGSAASNGIRMTGNEVLIATQQRKDYWLYVVDQCDDGVGKLFGVYEDPATLFASEMKGDAIFRVPGSALSTALGANK